MAFVVHFNDGRGDRRLVRLGSREELDLRCRGARVLPGRIIAHQSLGAFSSSNKISNRPPVLALMPRNRAGMTRELFNTSTSPARRNPSKSRNRRCSTRPPARCKTSSRDSSRLERGMLGDQFRRQGKIKISGSHRAISSRSQEIQAGKQDDSFQP